MARLLHSTAKRAVGVLKASICSISLSLTMASPRHRVPADELDGRSGFEDDFRGFGIHPDVVFGGGSDVALAARVAAHHAAAADVFDDAGIAADRQGDVREGSESDEHDSRISMYGLEDWRRRREWSGPLFPFLLTARRVG